MSLPLSEAILVPEPGLRRLVLGSGCVLLLCGSVLILTMPLAPLTCVVLLSLWILDGVREMRRLVRGRRRVIVLVLTESGTITATDADGRRHELTLLSGSVVLPRFAWLRLRFADKCQYGELIRGNADKDPQWQKLQLIWRQSAASFGRGS